MITLNQAEQAELKKVLVNNATDQQYKVLVFGSRVMGNAKRYSDVDVALVGEKSVPIQTLAALSEAFDESHLPYTVDVVDFVTASPTLQSQITQYGMELML